VPALTEADSLGLYVHVPFREVKCVLRLTDDGVLVSNEVFRALV
jgi:hypothetical protein